MPVIIDNLNNSRIEVLLAIKKLIQYTPEFIQGYVNEKSVMTEVFRNICPRQLYIFRHIRPLGKVESNH
jgi:UDP-glucose 4-epimerase